MSKNVKMAKNVDIQAGEGHLLILLYFKVVQGCHHAHPIIEA